jgi:formate C-acetyltransferase
MHGPIERGKDVTDIRAVDNNYTSVNVLGVPNVVDSIFAMKQLVFDEKRYTLKELKDALEKNWEGFEEMRQRFLNAHKFGNDIDDVDDMAVRVAEHIRQTLENKRNIKGFHFRPSLFQFMGHTYAGPYMGATPDGRYADEFLAHGMNPMHGRNTNGISATANSLCKIDLSRYQGGSLQIELDPASIKNVTEMPEYIKNFSLSFFQKNGVQVNLNIVNLKELEKAIEDPKNPKYQDIVVKVTGYSAHFVAMDPKLQREFVERVNYLSL